MPEEFQQSGSTQWIIGITSDSQEAIVKRDDECAAIHLETKKLRKLKSPGKRLPVRFSAQIRKTVYREVDKEKKQDRLMIYDFETGEMEELIRTPHPEEMLFASMDGKWQRKVKLQISGARPGVEHGLGRKLCSGSITDRRPRGWPILLECRSDPGYNAATIAGRGAQRTRQFP